MQLEPHLRNIFADSGFTSCPFKSTSLHSSFGLSPLRQPERYKKLDNRLQAMGKFTLSCSIDPVVAYALDERIKLRGRTDRYQKELTKITRANKLPPEWATPEQRARAALKAL
jgi:hypothetical protein